MPLTLPVLEMAGQAAKAIASKWTIESTHGGEMSRTTETGVITWTKSKVKLEVEYPIVQFNAPTNMLDQDVILPIDVGDTHKTSNRHLHDT